MVTFFGLDIFDLIEDDLRTYDGPMDEMIPHLTDPSATDAYLPPSVEQNGNILEELSRIHDSDLFIQSYPEFNQLSTYRYITYDEEYNESDPQRFSKFLKRDCKWTGCDQECQKTHYEDLNLDDWIPDSRGFNPNMVFPVKERNEIQPYTPDSDHCYYASASKQLQSEKDNIDILKNIPTPPSTSDSPSETSSEEDVDVVTVSEEYQLPVMARNFEAPRRNTRSQRKIQQLSSKTQQLSKTRQPSYKTRQPSSKTRQPSSKTRQPSSKTRQPSSKTLKHVVKIVEEYKLRTCKNSTQEITPSSSNTSSARSSRCSSDAEDNASKRVIHNSSERRRRDAQRTALHELKALIPAVKGNGRAPKVLILICANDHVKKLKLIQRTLQETKYKELKRRKDLLAKLNMLRIRLKV